MMSAINSLRNSPSTRNSEVRCCAPWGSTYWAEIFHHGDPDSDYQSDELLVLNLADMLTSKDGSATTIPARLTDIASRYGVESTQYVAAKKLADVLVAQVKEIDGSQEILSQLV